MSRYARAFPDEFKPLPHIPANTPTFDQWREQALDDDPTPYCSVCKARTAKECDCGPIAENE